MLSRSMLSAGILLTGNNQTVSTGLDIGKIFDNLKTKGETWGGAFIMVLGIICLIAAAIFIVQALLTHRHDKIVVIILLLFFGGWMLVGGFNSMTRLADIGAATVESLSQ